MQTISTQIEEHVRACHAAAKGMARMSTAQKDRALLAMADQLVAGEAAILEANAVDVAQARANGLSDAMVDRLVLNTERIAGMAGALRDVAAFDDPVGGMSETWTRPNGIRVGYMRIPLGVIAMIYESRPNVTSDAAGLCLKAGNAVVLRGGSEAFHSNQAVAAALHTAMEREGVPPAAITLLPTTDRAAIAELVTLNQYIDLVIPRGGEGLIRYVDENSRIPVIKHYKGVCHLFVDAGADVEMAVGLLLDGKVSRPGVCNALETLLVHRDAAGAFLPAAGAALRGQGVEVRGCARTRALLPGAAEATEADYDAEFLDLILAVRVVDDLDAAIAHIDRYGSDHTEVIATNNLTNAQRFVREVGSAVVLVNASSRFSDGGELGLGAEIGISTTKLHAYGPMGLESLTARKFVVMGEGQTRHG
jgi:glutamate-5-semialdehyde dehydrogenase